MSEARQASTRPEWGSALVGELVANFDSKRVPLSSLQRAARPGSYPYYGATGVMDHIDDFLFDGLHLLVGEDGSVERPDGGPFLQLVDGQFWVNNHAHVLRAKTDGETRFLYYALSQVPIRPYISGSVQAKLSQGNLNRIPIPLPPLEEQRAIADILGALDNKIESNLRLGNVTEVMLRAEFEARFPSALDGTSGTTVADLVVSVVDRRPDGSTTDADRYVSLDVMPARSIDLHDYAPGTDVGTSIQAFRTGDILFGAMRPYFHKVGLAQFDGYCRSTTLVLRTKADALRAFGVFALSDPRTIAYATDHSVGTTIPYVRWDALSRMPLDSPSLADGEAFRSVAEPLLGQLATHGRESRTLAALRDALLPELLSGRLRVPEARERVEAVT